MLTAVVSLHARPKFRPSSLSLPRREQHLIVAAGFAHMSQGHLGYPIAAAQSLRSSDSFSSSHTWLIGGKHRRPSWRRSIASPLANPALYLAKPSQKIYAGSHAHMPDCVPLRASQHRAGAFLSLQCPTGCVCAAAQPTTGCPPTDRVLFPASHHPLVAGRARSTATVWQPDLPCCSPMPCPTRC